MAAVLWSREYYYNCNHGDSVEYQDMIIINYELIDTVMYEQLIYEQ